MKMYIRDDAWKIRDADITNLGECSSSERLVEIRRGLRPKQRLGTLIHELLHATCPYLDENEVAEIELVLAYAIWKDKWRRKT